MENLISIDFKQVMLLPDGTEIFVKVSPSKDIIGGVKHGFYIETSNDIIGLNSGTEYKYYIEQGNKKSIINKFYKYYKDSGLTFMQCVQNIYDTYMFETGDVIELWQMDDGYICDCVDKLGNVKL